MEYLLPFGLCLLGIMSIKSGIRLSKELDEAQLAYAKAKLENDPHQIHETQKRLYRAMHEVSSPHEYTPTDESLKHIGVLCLFLGIVWMILAIIF